MQSLLSQLRVVKMNIDILNKLHKFMQREQHGTVRLNKVKTRSQVLFIKKHYLYSKKWNISRGEICVAGCNPLANGASLDRYLETNKISVMISFRTHVRAGLISELDCFLTLL